ncbi:MAG: AAA family ATPase [Sporichthyaceae bacterium]|nr:AAA family ATPase [Sporichthyaceae bacterium]
MTGQPRRARAVLVSGPPAAGKTTVGRALAGHLGAALLDLDTATAPLVAVLADLLGTADLDDRRLVAATRHARYETLVALAEDNLRAGMSVVLVAPFTAERRDAATWGEMTGRLRDAGGEPLLVWLRLDTASVAARLRARRADRDRAKSADPETVAASLDLGAPDVPHVVVEAVAPLDAVLAAARAAVDSSR